MFKAKEVILMVKVFYLKNGIGVILSMNEIVFKLSWLRMGRYFSILKRINFYIRIEFHSQFLKIKASPRVSLSLWDPWFFDESLHFTL